MDAKQFLQKLTSAAEQSKYAVLSTHSKGEELKARWMCPVFFNRTDVVYAITLKRNEKSRDVKLKEQVHWLFQDTALVEVFSVCGHAVVIDNPSLKAQVIERLGPKLGVFWKGVDDTSDLVVIETTFTEGEYFNSQTLERETVKLV
jgi:pyridoxamine 5'-phosphate oxidase